MGSGSRASLSESDSVSDSEALSGLTDTRKLRTAAMLDCLSTGLASSQRGRHDSGTPTAETAESSVEIPSDADGDTYP